MLLSGLLYHRVMYLTYSTSVCVAHSPSHLEHSSSGIPRQTHLFPYGLISSILSLGALFAFQALRCRIGNFASSGCAEKKCVSSSDSRTVSEAGSILTKKGSHRPSERPDFHQCTDAGMYGLLELAPGTRLLFFPLLRLQLSLAVQRV